MNNLFYDSDAFESIILKLNREYENMMDAYERFLSEIVSEDKLPEPIKVRICEIKDELRRLSDTVLKLRIKAKAVKDCYDDVEETNYRFVNNLPKEIQFLENRNMNNTRRLELSYAVKKGTDTVNSSYDFEDWLVEWVSAN